MRNDYYYQQGLDKLNKEGDIGYIIKQIRVMRYFLKTVLEKDQRVLLKMKSRDIVTSADENQVDKAAFKKKLNKGKLLERYVETLQKKIPTPQDARLLNVLGQGEAYELLTQQKEKAQQNTVEDVVKNFI